ncbi:hypothetical protein ACFFTM_24260 [Pseudoduganella plicata]|uniref:O-antigen ligase domain-containing protein n=1 Tax=Pseudoduganella plicata TaxID=321984 RepID=A0A4P7BGF6_9BURK|nr:hypothetical protein [Pseudoduganella plicata]QBQ37360.1 hypothetical protein E1742_15200 [Pseudoduganella plicata]GGZ08904.1 hypothetical protein GCM10007388_48000 [Pseudoduganella plicata]
MIATLGARAGACAALLLLAGALSVYPLAANPATGPWLFGALAAYAVLLWYRPTAWLLVVPALLPVLDFAPWTGWFYLVELDLVLLTTCAVGYWRLAAVPVPVRLPPLTALALLLTVLCLTVAAWRGITPFAPLDANAFSNYISPWNALRILKGFIWPIALLPLLRRSAGAQLENLPRLLVPGMLLGLVGAGLAVAWERTQFPGLLNFSSDYRPTAPFSAMHTGGAALDAYLAMALPFVAMWLTSGVGGVRLALGMGCLLLGTFAGLTLFSRDIYLAYVSSAAVLALILAYRELRGARLRARTLFCGLGLLVLLGVCLTQVFAASGYRGLLAALGTLSLAVLAGGAAPRVRAPLLGVAVGLALVLAAVALSVLAPDAASNQWKGAYVSYALAFVTGAAGAALLLRQRHAGVGVVLLLAALPALMLATLLVAWHHAGPTALASAAVALAAAALLAAHRWLPRPMWHLDQRALMLAFCALIVLATVIPVTGSYYTEVRFATVARDLRVRLQHWSEALEMMDRDTDTQLSGMGLGKYPATYLWRNTHGEMPGTFSYVREGTNTYLRLGAAQYSAGYGDALRFLQQVDVRPGARYTVAADLRRSGDEVMPRIALCERWLLYPRSCQHVRLQLKKGERGWQHYEGTVAAPFEPHWLAGYAPVRLQIASESAGGALEVDNVSVRDVASGRELLANGSFSAANDYWFFSSDRNHMPWHVKNFMLNAVFEMGWLGAAALGFLILSVAARLLREALAGSDMSAVFLASLTGAMMVGLFDSITDVPRLTLLLLLLALAGALVPAPQQAGRRPRSTSRQAADALMS